MNFKKFKKGVVLGVTILAICALSVPSVFAQAVPGGTLDPLTIPKYVTPLVIPPVMNEQLGNGLNNDYDIAVRQFQQQILPGGIWNAVNGRHGLPFRRPRCGATALRRIRCLTHRSWRRGRYCAGANSQFNYPAYTVENTAQTLTTTVDWINDLVADPIACKAIADPATDPACNFLPHLLPVDQTLHWANPAAVTGDKTDCRGYTIQTALHRTGSHHHSRARRPCRPGERRLPRGLVPARARTTSRLDMPPRARWSTSTASPTNTVTRRGKLHATPTTSRRPRSGTTTTPWA